MLFVCVCVCIEDGNRVLATRSWHGLIVFHSHIFLLIQIHKCDRKTLFRSRQFSTKYCKKMRSYVMHCLLDIVHVRVMLNATFSHQKNILCVPLALSLSLTHSLPLRFAFLFGQCVFDNMLWFCRYFNLQKSQCHRLRHFFVVSRWERERECTYRETYILPIKSRKYFVSARPSYFRWLKQLFT